MNNQLLTNLIDLFNNLILAITPYNSSEIRKALGQINSKYNIAIFVIINNMLAIRPNLHITNDMIMDIIDQFLFISGYQSKIVIN